MSGGGYTYGGPDSALELLQGSLTDDVKHAEKLSEQEAIRRHWCAWTDAATPEDIRSAFAADEQQLPGRPPELPEGVTDLWVIDEILRRGWHWSASRRRWDRIVDEADRRHEANQ